jgi:hypothetical protein
MTTKAITNRELLTPAGNEKGKTGWRKVADKVATLVLYIFAILFVLGVLVGLTFLFPHAAVFIWGAGILLAMFILKINTGS